MSVSIEEQLSIQEHDAKLVNAITPGLEEGIPAFNIGSSCSINSGDGLSTSIIIPSCNIEQHCRLLEVENQTLKDTQIRQQQQCTDAQRRERILMRRLANKEQELQDYVSQIAEYKASQAPENAALRQVLLDPAVNMLIENLKKELQATKAKLEETQNELSAWKFTPDSNTGKRLMAKCRLLYQENEELGKMTSNGRLAKLENELAMQKSFSDEVKKSQSELDDFLQELDEDVEGMQSTILYLQHELKITRDRIQFLEKENLLIKNSTTLDSIKPTSNGQELNNTDDEDTSIVSDNLRSVDNKTDYFREINKNISEETSLINTNLSSVRNIIDNSDSTIYEIKNLTRSNNNSNNNNNNNNNSGNLLRNFKDNPVYGKTNDNGINDELLTTNNILRDNLSDCNNDDILHINTVDINKKIHLKKRTYDSDSSVESCGTNGGVSSKLNINKKPKKKTRRSSVLSIDLNEEDTKIAASDDDDCTNQKITSRRKSIRNHQHIEN